MIFLLAQAGLEGPSIQELDRLASARDVASISRYVTNLPAQNPLDVLQTNGPYGVGTLGWHAKALSSPSGESFVVLTTPLTSEDVGEFLFTRAGDKLTWIPESDAMGVQVLGHQLDLTFDIPAKTARVSDRFHFSSTGQGWFAIRMGDEYKVSSVTGEDGSQLPFNQAGGTVLLSKPAKSEATYTIVYSGVVNRPKFAGSIGEAEATLANEYWYPMVARQPAPYSLTVHAPRGWTVVGQGVRELDQDGSTEKLSKFRMDLPVIYYSVSAGKYATQTVDASGRVFTCWSPRMSEDAMKAQAETLDSVIGFYEKFGKFPFASYGDLDSPSYGGGALEAYSYATYGDGGLPDEDAHEPSHTWWGGIIDNTYLKSFWNESFAVFSEGLYRREVSIGNHEERKIAFIQDGGTDDAYDRFACANAGADRGLPASTLGYGKGARVLQMLEVLMGTDSMIASMNRWVREQPSGKPGEWEDYEKAAEEERPDLHLETFFADWIDRPGHADLDATASYETGAINLNITFTDLPYRLPLEVLIGNADGTTRVVTLDVSKSGPYPIESASKPAFVSLDPYLRLIRPIANSELPPRLDQAVGNLQPYLDPAQPDWAATFGAKNAGALPEDPAGALLVGSPETSPLMARLCEQVGFSVSGGRLTYDGTTVDLNHGGAIALVDLPGGKHCVIALGKSRIRPHYGRARLAVFDDLGRVLRAKSDVKTSGHLTYRF
jgi:hypothetical protein